VLSPISLSAIFTATGRTERRGINEDVFDRLAVRVPDLRPVAEAHDKLRAVPALPDRLGERGRIDSTSTGWFRNKDVRPCEQVRRMPHSIACPAASHSAGESPSVPCTLSTGECSASSRSLAAWPLRMSKVRITTSFASFASSTPQA